MARYHNDYRSRKYPTLRKIKKKYLIFAEGCVTEPEYFRKINSLTSDRIEVSCILQKGKGLDPNSILKSIASEIKKRTLLPNDEIWAVLDRDEWTEDQLNALVNWAKRHRGRFIGMSNPKFEYWLLLHFEKPKKTLTEKGCTAALKRHLPNYDKHIRVEISIDHIRQAISRAKELDQPPCKYFPDQNGSTVYRLLESIFRESDQAG